MLDKVLIPLDGSRRAEGALDHGLALAGAFAAELHLLRVLEPPPQAEVDCVDWRFQRSEAEAYLRRVAEELGGHGLAVEWAVGEGRAAEEIIEQARRIQADLVILTPYGHGEAREFALGSTASKVVSNVGVSVLMARAGEGDDRTYRSVLVAVDGSSRAEWAACLAATIARSQGARLVLVHVVQEAEVPATMACPPEQEELARRLAEGQRSSAERYLGELEDKLQSPQLEVVSRVSVSHHVPQELERIAQEEEASLVVLSAHGSHDVGPWLYGRTAEMLLAHVAKPVLVLQDSPPAQPLPQPENHSELRVPARV